MVLEIKNFSYTESKYFSPSTSKWELAIIFTLYTNIKYQNNVVICVLIKTIILIAFSQIAKLSKKRYFETLGKAFISFIAIWYLYNNQHFSINIDYDYYLIFLINFSILNWYFEIKKWQFLSNQVQKTNFYTAFKQSIISFSISLLTPNRIGEYGAKVLFYDSKKRKKIFGLSLIGNISQLFTTIIFGVLALSYLFFSNNLHLNKTNISIPYFIVATVILLAILLIIYRYKSKWINTINFNFNIWKNAILYSFLRYLIFSTQFYLIWYYYYTGYDNIYIAIFLTYFISSIVPILAFLDWAVKGSVAVFVFQYLELPTEKILEIVGLMWIYNFAIPFLIGLIIIWTTKFKLK